MTNMQKPILRVGVCRPFCVVRWGRIRLLRRMGGEEMARELQETVQAMSDAEVPASYDALMMRRARH
eukprot:COSAG01_NODE_12491_length_1729_cov_106.217178_2_plen_67_part_00